MLVTDIVEKTEVAAEPVGSPVISVIAVSVKAPEKKEELLPEVDLEVAEEVPEAAVDSTFVKNPETVEEPVSEEVSGGCEDAETMEDSKVV